MKFIINASPIIFLAKIEMIEHLPDLFDEIIIPAGVFNEVIAHDDEKLHIGLKTMESNIYMNRIPFLVAFTHGIWEEVKPKLLQVR